MWLGTWLTLTLPLTPLLLWLACWVQTKRWYIADQNSHYSWSYFNPNPCQWLQNLTMIRTTLNMIYSNIQVSLELGTLCKKYPDVTHEQLLCLLLLRGDQNRGWVVTARKRSTGWCNTFAGMQSSWPQSLWLKEQLPTKPSTLDPSSLRWRSPIMGLSTYFLVSGCSDQHQFDW